MVDLVDAVMEDTAGTWSQLLRRPLSADHARCCSGMRSSPRCGFAQSAAGPFYCPATARSISI